MLAAEDVPSALLTDCRKVVQGLVDCVESVTFMKVLTADKLVQYDITSYIMQV
jgi:hypothetical protein